MPLFESAKRSDVKTGDSSITDGSPTLDTQAPRRQPVNSSEEEKLEDNDVLGQVKSNADKYKSVSFIQCGFLLVAETISLGILTLPSTVATVGWIPYVPHVSH